MPIMLLTGREKMYLVGKIRGENKVRKMEVIGKSKKSWKVRIVYRFLGIPIFEEITHIPFDHPGVRPIWLFWL